MHFEHKQTTLTDSTYFFNRFKIKIMINELKSCDFFYFFISKEGYLVIN